MSSFALSEGLHGDTILWTVDTCIAGNLQQTRHLIFLKHSTSQDERVSEATDLLKFKNIGYE